jgi:hypothetical protein
MLVVRVLGLLGVLRVRVIHIPSRYGESRLDAARCTGEVDDQVAIVSRRGVVSA